MGQAILEGTLLNIVKPCASCCHAREVQGRQGYFERLQCMLAGCQVFVEVMPGAGGSGRHCAGRSAGLCF